MRHRLSWLLLAALPLALLPLAFPDAAHAVDRTFLSTGGEQTFTVPAGVTSVHIVAVGGKGSGTDGGLGGTATADLAVAPGATLYVEVGGAGVIGGSSFNGGGAGQGFPGVGGGGGGASDVRTVARATANSTASRLLVAGGGGGAAFEEGGNGPYGGNGGGTQGGSGSGLNGGAGGTQSTGGAGGVGGNGNGDENSAGGGGGYWGGAGGGMSGGGGGGSGYFGAGTSNGVFGLAAATDPASVKISYTAPASPAAALDTKLLKHPKPKIKTDKKTIKVRFTFSASDPNATFRCQLDDAKEKACDPGVRYRVRRGFHQFTVVAVLTGVRDPTPARFSFSVKKAKEKQPHADH